MGLKIANNASTTLASSITDVATTMSVAAGTGAEFPSLGAGDYFYCTIVAPNGTMEIVKVTDRDDDDFTIERAQDGSTAAAFSAGATVENRMNKATFADILTASNAAAALPTPVADEFLGPYSSGSSEWASLSKAEMQAAIGGTVGANVLAAATAAAAQQAMDVEVGVDVQANVVTTEGDLIVANSSGAASRLGIGSAGQVLTSNGTTASWAANSSGATQQQVRQIYLNSARIAIGQSLASGELADGYEWTFITDELATSTNATYDSAGDYYHNPGAQSEVDYAGSTNIGDMTSGGGLAAAFNGITAQADSACAASGSTTTGKFVGKDWGVGNTKNLTGVKVWGASNNGYAKNAQVVSIYLYGSATAPASATDGTVLGTIAASLADTDSSNPKELLTGVTSGDYRYHWVAVVPAGSTDAVLLAEVEFYEGGEVQNMTLIPSAVTANAAPEDATLYFVHKAVDSVTLGTDIKVRVTRDNGSTWTAYETTTAEYIEVADIGSNWKLLQVDFDLSTLTSGTSVKWEIVTQNEKEQQLGAVLIAWG